MVFDGYAGIAPGRGYEPDAKVSIVVAAVIAGIAVVWTRSTAGVGGGDVEPGVGRASGVGSEAGRDGRRRRRGLGERGAGRWCEGG